MSMKENFERHYKQLTKPWSRMTSSEKQASYHATDRLHESRAVDSIKKMSKSKALSKAKK